MPRPKTGGRQKGTPNKNPNPFTVAVKEGIEHAVNALGGYERLAEWVKEHEANERAFWTSIVPKLLPVQLNAEHRGQIDVNVKTVQDLMGKTRGL